MSLEKNDSGYGKDSFDKSSWEDVLSGVMDAVEKKKSESGPRQAAGEKATQQDAGWRERQAAGGEKGTQQDAGWRERQAAGGEKGTQQDAGWRERLNQTPGQTGAGFADIRAFQEAAEGLQVLRSAGNREYRVERTLSKAGGEAAILLCRDDRGERFVAKLYFYAVSESALTARKRVLDYMKTPEGKKYTLAVCDLGMLDMAGTRYYYEITPYCPDGDLSTHGPMDFDELVALTEHLNEALHSIHSAGILHRDIKPRNLYWNGERVLIGDFGVARLAGNGATTTTVGTEGYRAPETVLAVTGEDSAYFFDEKTDYYSLGVTLASLFEGHFVYEGMNSAMISIAVRNSRLPLQRQDPHRRQLENLLCGLVRFDSRDRFGYDQVRAWLKNHDFEGSSRAAVEWIRPFGLLDVDYWDEQSLFEAVTKDKKHWDEGRKMLYGNYFEQFFKSFNTNLARAAERASETWRSRDEDRGLAIFLKSLYPAGALVWKGYTFRSTGELAEKMQKTTTPAAYGDMLSRGLVSHWMTRTTGLKVKAEIVELAERIEALAKTWPEEACYWFGNCFSPARELSICSSRVRDLEGLLQALFSDPAVFFGQGGYQALTDRKAGAALYGFLDSLGGLELLAGAWEQAGKSDEYGRACILFAALDQMAEKKGTDPGILRRFFRRYGPVGISACVKKLAEQACYQAMDAQGRKLLAAVTEFREPDKGSVEALVKAYEPLDAAVRQLRQALTDNPFLIQAGAIEEKGLVCRELRGCFACQVYGRSAPLAFETLVRQGKGGARA